MRYVYTSKQAKEIDHHAITTMGFPGLVLMERAAMSVAAVIMEKIPKGKRVLCICGTGNNGGDGIAVARLLYQAGYNCAMSVIGQSEHMSDETKKQFEMAVNCGVPFVQSDSISKADVLVDAIFGIGLNRPIEGVYEEIIRKMNQSGKYIFAVDCPSGVDCTSGSILNIAVTANETVTFGVNKLGMILYPGAMNAGQVTVADIGFPRDSVANISNPAYIYESEDINLLPARSPYSNKGTFGKVLVVAGSETMSGACYLAAKASYVMGAGLVKVVTSAENRNVILGSLPEVLFSTYEDLKQGIQWADVIVAGPGLGLSARTKELIAGVLHEKEKPVLIDGDGLQYVNGLECHSNVILTPHLKEMTYLNGKTVADIQHDIIMNAAIQAQKRNCVIALKDARTIVTAGNQVYINVSGNNGMSTGGTGDVLAGTIAGLLAQKMNSFAAAKLGVFIHGLAGDCMIQERGKFGLLASDLLEGLVRVTSQVD